jgi:hypothetical protein
MKVEIEWIALSDRLPESERRVFLFGSYNSFAVGFLSPESEIAGSEWWDEQGLLDIRYYSHWAYPVGVVDEN